MKNLNQKQDVLIEGVQGNFSYGLTKNHIKVHIQKNNLKINDIARVRMIDIKETSMIGELI